ncbi:MAG: glycosyltransferase, partial [Bacteroidetes bacterium]|nr:glycosyltransferase [Bacteroidota bacterium]
VGVNTEIVKHGHNGSLAKELDEWESSLRALIEDTQLRKAMGKRGRETVEDRFSVASNSSNFLRLFTTRRLPRG